MEKWGKISKQNPKWLANKRTEQASRWGFKPFLCEMRLREYKSTLINKGLNYSISVKLLILETIVSQHPWSDTYIYLLVNEDLSLRLCKIGTLTFSSIDVFKCLKSSGLLIFQPTFSHVIFSIIRVMLIRRISFGPFGAADFSVGKYIWLDRQSVSLNRTTC